MLSAFSSFSLLPLPYSMVSGPSSRTLTFGGVVQPASFWLSFSDMFHLLIQYIVAVWFLIPSLMVLACWFSQWCLFSHLNSLGVFPCSSGSAPYIFQSLVLLMLSALYSLSIVLLMLSGLSSFSIVLLMLFAICQFLTPSLLAFVYGNSPLPCPPSHMYVLVYRCSIYV